MKAWLAFMALVITLHLSVLTASGQDSNSMPSKATAQEAWNRGNYEVAYDHFNGLLLLYSRDPVYRYYTGACLVKLERDLPRAVTLLGSAINGSVNVKSVPDDVWFYYGRALQMSGSFTHASDAYQTFAKNAGKKVALEYDVQKYIDECSRGQGASSMLTNEVSKSREAGEQGAKGTEQVASGKGQGEERTLSGEATTNKDALETKTYGPGQGAQSEASGVPGEFDRKLALAVNLQYSADSRTTGTGRQERDGDGNAGEEGDPSDCS